MAGLRNAPLQAKLESLGPLIDDADLMLRKLRDLCGAANAQPSAVSGDAGADGSADNAGEECVQEDTDESAVKAVLHECVYPQLEELEARMERLRVHRVIVSGARGSGKSTLWNALLAPANSKVTAEGNVRVLPMRPFGTCSAVPIEISTLDKHSKFQARFEIDVDFVMSLLPKPTDVMTPKIKGKPRQLKEGALLEKTRSMHAKGAGHRTLAAINSSVLEEMLGLVVLKDAAFAVQPYAKLMATSKLAELRAWLLLHCTLPVSEEGDHKSLWPFLRYVRVTGPFGDTFLPPGVVLVDAPGTGDGYDSQRASWQHAVKYADSVLCVIECNQLLQASSATHVLETIRALKYNVVVVVTKFLDTTRVDEQRQLLEEQFHTNAIDMSDTEVLDNLSAAVIARFRQMLASAVIADPSLKEYESQIMKLQILPVSARNYLKHLGSSNASTGITKLQDVLGVCLVEERRQPLEEVLHELRRLVDGDSGALAKLHKGDEQAAIALRSQFDKHLATIGEELNIIVTEGDVTSQRRLESSLLSSGNLPAYNTLAARLRNGEFANLVPLLTYATKTLLEGMMAETWAVPAWPAPAKASAATKRLHRELRRSLQPNMKEVQHKAHQLLMEEALRQRGTAQFLLEARKHTLAKLATLLRKCWRDSVCERLAEAWSEEVKAAAACLFDQQHCADVARTKAIGDAALQRCKDTVSELRHDDRQISYFDGLQFFPRIKEKLEQLDRAVSALIQPMTPNEVYSNLSTEAIFEGAKSKPAGCIYIMRCDAHRENIVKIGETTVCPRTRATQVFKGSGVPDNFVVYKAHPVPHHTTLYERLLHNLLRGLRVNERREFFHIAPADAAEIVEAVCEVPVGAH